MATERPKIDTMWNYGKPEETREKFLELLKEQEATAPLEYTLELKTQIARTFSLQANFEKAHGILDEVESQLTSDTPVAKVRYLLERGRSFNSDGKKEKARQLFVSSYSEARTISAANYAIDAAHMVAIAAKDLDEKIAWSEKGIAEAKSAEDPKVKRWIGVFYNNMGWDLFEAKRYEEALEKFQQCENFHREQANEGPLSRAKWSVAKTYRLLGKTEESLKIQLALLEATNGVDESGYGYEELAELYFVKGDKEKSSNFFRKAYELLSKDVWLQKNEGARLERMKKLSER